MRMCRTIFSISTMASSTSTPATSDSASRVIWLSEKFIHCMKANVGTAESGIASRISAWPATAQEQPHHGDRQNRSFDERVQGRVISSERVVDRGGNERHLDRRILALNLGELGLYGLGDADIRGALALNTPKAVGAPVEPRDGANLGDASCTFAISRRRTDRPPPAMI